MTSEEIKVECKKMSEQISYAQERLAELREICKHEHTFEGNYSWRIGSIQWAKICSDCGSLINYINE